MDSEKNCSCKNYQNYLWIDRAKTTQLTAILLILAVGIFIGGFMVGNRKALDSLTEDLKQQAFADELQHSMLMLYGDIPQKIEQNPTECQPVTENTTAINSQPSYKYYAQIAKFPTLKAAQIAVARLQKNGIGSTIIKRESKQPSTQKKVPWYQLTTHAYATQDEVDAAVTCIKALEPKVQVTVHKKI